MANYTARAMPELIFDEPSRASGPQAAAQEMPDVAWFCLRTQPKHEKIASHHLALMGDVEVFNPRIRFTRHTRLGPAPVTESMFPGYLFARFDWRTALARVHYANGVSCVVHFGSRWPIVPDAAIQEIRALLLDGDGGVRVIEQTPAAGEEVELRGRAFEGLQGVVAQALPGSQRVMVLMDFLGRQCPVHVGMQSIVRPQMGR